MNGSTIDPRLRAALDGVIDPELRRPITELGMVDSAVVREGRVEVSVLLTVQGCPLRGTIEQDVREAALTVAGIDDVAVSVGYMSPEQRQRLRERLDGLHGTALIDWPASASTMSDTSHALVAGLLPVME